MSNGKRVRLRVVDETGVPVEGALVSVLRSTVAFPEIALVTDVNGVVMLPLPEGRFVIGANAEGERHGQVQLDSIKNDFGDAVTLVVRPVQQP